MSRKTIAPVLHGLAHYSYGASTGARRELRALLAVVRAAERMHRLHKRQWNGPGAIAREDLARALSRLRSPGSATRATRRTR